MLDFSTTILYYHFQCGFFPMIFIASTDLEGISSSCAEFFPWAFSDLLDHTRAKFWKQGFQEQCGILIFELGCVERKFIR